MRRLSANDDIAARLHLLIAERDQARAERDQARAEFAELAARLAEIEQHEHSRPMPRARPERRRSGRGG